MEIPIVTSLLGNNLILAAISSSMALVGTFYLMPKVIGRMRESGHVGRDVNKKDKPLVPEMGGVGPLISIFVTLTLVGGAVVLADVYDNMNVIFVAMATMFIASYLGLFDDIAVISRKMKAIGLLLTGLPLAVARPVSPVILIPLDGVIDFASYYPMYILFWLVLVPFGIMGAANAFNMAAGYNGLESGEATIISLVLLILSVLYNSDIIGVLIFSAAFGGSFGLYYFNRYPAKTFVGDVGTLSIGALIAAGTIISGLEVYGIILILPMFYEAFATAYYANIKKVERRDACMNPKLDEDGHILVPKGAKYYTLAFLLLSRRKMGEKELVNRLLSLYMVIGIICLAVSIVDKAI